MKKNIAYSHRIFALQARGGISRYFCELGTRVHQSRDFECKVFAPLHYNEHLLDSDVPRQGTYLRYHRKLQRIYNYANSLMAPRLARASLSDLFHHTYYAPSDMNWAKTNVVTVYDMIHELYSEEFGTSDPTSDRKRLCVERADHVICISHNTAADLIRLFGISPDKVSVTHLSMSDTFSLPPPSDEKSPHVKPYILYVGQRSGYKNFKQALEAYAASSRLRREVDFATFGGFEFDETEIALIESLGLDTASVVRLSGSDAALARAYRHARVFIYPSLYEGFGIPPLEAMSCGCPVVSSNSSSLPEVIGDAALAVDASDVEEIRVALERTCFEDSSRNLLIERGLEQASKFSWDRCAEETMQAYRRVLGAETSVPFATIQSGAA